jgi:syntaxin 5
MNSVQGISHSEVIVGQLKGQLLGFTQSLKGILVARSESMRAQADRRQQFGGVRDLGRPLTFGGPPPPSAASSLSSGTGGAPAAAHPHPAFSAGAAAAGGRGGAAQQHQQHAGGGLHRPPSSQHDGGGDAVINFSASHSPSAAAFQQLSQAQLVPESALLETRAQDVQAIERHINDLSQLFSRLAVVVAEQASLVERIEDNTTDALSNMEAGQAQLARYWERVSSNRGLVLRVASTLVVSAVLFALFGT